MTFKILIVDDEPDIVVLLAKFLRDAGFEVASAGNGLEAFNMIQSWNPHLVISDVQMPVWDGFKLLKSLQDLPSHSTTPILIISGYVGGNEFEFRQSPNFVGFVAKPFNTRRLVDSVKSYLENHNAPGDS